MFGGDVKQVQRDLVQISLRNSLATPMVVNWKGQLKLHTRKKKSGQLNWNKQNWNELNWDKLWFTQLWQPARIQNIASTLLLKHNQVTETEFTAVSHREVAGDITQFNFSEKILIFLRFNLTWMLLSVLFSSIESQTLKQHK